MWAMDKEPVRLSDQIRQAVSASGLSHYGICKVLGIDKGLMSRFMAGKAGLSVANLDALAELLRLKIVSTGKPAAIPKGKPGRPRKAG